MLALISLQNTFIDFGIRYIAAAVREAGIDTDILWLHRPPDKLLDHSEMDQVLVWLKRKQYTAVGMNVMSVHYTLAVQITKKIKAELGIPVIWGGVHAVICSEECLGHADYVCVGEGEKSIIPLMNAIKTGDVPEDLVNFWYKRGDEILRNERQLVEDLNTIPPPDYSLDQHWVLTEGRVVACTIEELQKGFPWNFGRHYLISSRGCPYDCAYCCNSAIKKIMGQKMILRFRSVENMMCEIDSILNQFPFLKTFAIMDDSFFFKPGGWIEDFCEKFKARNAYFGVLLHPKTVERERMKKLIDAGLIGIQMGLQSGSDRVSRDVFHRPDAVKDFVKAANILDEFIPPLQARTYDIIVDNPYETEEDLETTIRLLTTLNKPFSLDLFSLTLYPGTPMYDEYISTHGQIPDYLNSQDKDFIQYKHTVLNRLMWLTHSNPSWIILFFLKHHRQWWGKRMIQAYDYVWEKNLRVFLRNCKRRVLRLIQECCKRPAG